MKIGFVGLGKMGGNMVKRLLAGGHQVAGYDPSEAARKTAEKNGAEPAASLEELIKNLPPPRAVRSMVPAGEVTESVVTELSELLSEGDVLIDGGNSNFRDSILRAGELREKGIAALRNEFGGHGFQKSD